VDESDRVSDGLLELFRQQECCDVELICAEVTLLAHKLVLACSSPIFRQGLADATASGDGSARQQVRLADVCNPEAVTFMLSYMYQIGDIDAWHDYNPKTQEINKDVLRLAKNFELPGLTQKAMHWMSKDLSTANVVERLTICEEFCLEELKSRIIGQLANNKKALFEVANSSQIMAYPKLMQSLLQEAAGQPEEPASGPKGKKQRVNA